MEHSVDYNVLNVCVASRHRTTSLNEWHDNEQIIRSTIITS